MPRDFRTGPNRILNGKNEIERQGRKRGTFSAEFKEEAARMVVETSRSIARVARELRVSETTLGLLGESAPGTPRRGRAGAGDLGRRGCLS